MLFLICFFTLVSGLNNRDLVVILDDVLANLPSIDIPDVSVKQLNLFANATNIQVYNLSLTTLFLDVKDESHLEFQLGGMHANLRMDLDAGITGPIPLDHKSHADGTLDLSLDVTFVVAGGNGKISSIKIDITTLKIDFGGTDAIAQFLVNVFTPVLKKTLNSQLPNILVKLFSGYLDFQHLMTLIFGLIKDIPIPDIDLALPESFDFSVSNIKLSEMTSVLNTFSMDGHQLIMEMSGIDGGGTLDFQVRTSKQTTSGNAVLKLYHGTIRIVTKIENGPDGTDLNYVECTNDIEKITLSSDDPDPNVQWYLAKLAPMVQTLFETAIPALIQTILSL